LKEKISVKARLRLQMEVVWRQEFWRYIPGSSRSFGPTRRKTTLIDAAKSCGEWIKVHGAYKRETKAPRVFGNIQPNYYGMITEDRPEVGIGILPNTYVVSWHGWTVLRDDSFIADSNIVFGSEKVSPRYELFRQPPAKRLEGKTLNLLSYHSGTNFGHSLMDALSRTYLVQKAGFSLNDFDHILWPAFNSPDGEWFKDRLEVDRNKLVFLGRRDAVVCDWLYQPSFPGLTRDYEPWVNAFFHSLMPPTEKRDLRIYIPRRAKPRSMLNEDEVEAYLHSKGFITLGYEKPRQPVLSQASIVVGSSGAALASVCYCAPGTKFLELLPSDHQFPYHQSLTMAALDFNLLLCLQERHTSHTGFPSFSDFRVDMVYLREAVETLLGTPNELALDA
jgi:capsular polysaccharide biosynthesis protein